MKFDWRDGNQISLLENGEEFFPRVFECIRAAKREVLIETFILFDDKIGCELRAALLDAAGRGVKIDLTVDGYGSADLGGDFAAAMTRAGVKIHMFDPKPRVMGKRVNLFRRLHRKIVVIDAERAFVGGINFSADHVADFGPGAKQDYAVEIVGPLVDDIHRFAHETVKPSSDDRRWWRKRTSTPTPRQISPTSGGARALFVRRDNDEHRDDIEEHYLEAIRASRHRLVIANAYFFPGYRLLRELRNAARRGVQVRLILQGEPDMPIAKLGARMLYNYLIRDGVQIHEYCRRPLHGKVALVDYDWSTVGSSNLDPLSLALNLESNVIIRDAEFNRTLYERLERLMSEHCRQIPLERVLRGYFWRAPVIFLIFHFLRRFPAMVGLLPAHTPKLALIQPHEESDIQPIGREKTQ
jgi:cardiolipin synthase